MPSSKLSSCLLLMSVVATGCGRATSVDHDASTVALPPGASAEAVSLMKSVEETYAQLKTLAVEERSTLDQVYLNRYVSKLDITRKLWMGRPYRYRMEYRATGKNGMVNEPLKDVAWARDAVSDGKTHYTIFSKESGCIKDTAPAMDVSYRADSEEPQFYSFYGLADHITRLIMQGYWTTDVRLWQPGFRSIRIVGKEEWEGKPYTVVEWTYHVDYSLPDDDNLHNTRLFIGDDKLVHRIVTKTPKYSEDSRYTLQPNADIPEERFTTPPPGPACKPRPAYASDPKWEYLAVGTKAPDFSLTDATTGKTWTLRELLAGKKALLLNFMGYS